MPPGQIDFFYYCSQIYVIHEASIFEFLIMIKFQNSYIIWYLWGHTVQFKAA